MSSNTTATANPLSNQPIAKLMVNFAVPSIIAMIVGALYNIIDQLFIGHAVGTLGNAATNIAFPLSTACIAISLLFGIGGASCFNLTMGAGKTDKAGYYIGNSITMLTLCGVVLSVITLTCLNPLLKLFAAPDDVFPYAEEYVKITALGFPFLLITTGGAHLVRADGSPRMTMACNLVGAVINTVLDALFVLGLDMGMTGAAYATIIGQIVSAVMVIVYLFNFKTVKLTKAHFIPDFKVWIRVASLGVASFFNQVAIMLVQIVMNNLLKHYGALSEYGESIPIAVSGIVIKVFQVIFSIVIGLSQGAQPIISFNYGAGNYKRVKKAYIIALTGGAIISVISFIMYQFFPRQILSMFGSASDADAELYFEFGVKYFRIFLFFTWLNCIQPVTTTFFTSIGKPLKGAFLSLTRQIIFLLPVLIILPKFIGIIGILYSGPVADLLAGIIAIIMAVAEFREMKRLENTPQRLKSI